MQEAVAQGENVSLAVNRHLDVMDLTALLVGGDQMLAPVFDPLHRASQAQGRVGNEDLLRIEQHDLGAESPADIGRDHLDVELREPEHVREAVADGEGRLGRIPHPEDTGARVVFGHHTTALEGTPAAPLDDEPLAENAGGLSPGAVGIPDRLQKAGGPVGGDVVMNARRALVESGLRVDDGGQRRVVDLDEGGGVLGPVAAVGHDEGHGLAHETDLVLRERALGAGSGEGGVRNEEGAGLVQHPEVGGGEHQMNAGEPAGAGGVESEDAGPSVRAAQTRRVQHACRSDVVHEAAAPAQQARILVTENARADRPCTHADSTLARESRRCQICPAP